MTTYFFELMIEQKKLFGQIKLIFIIHRCMVYSNQSAIVRISALFHRVSDCVKMVEVFFCFFLYFSVS